MDQLCSVTTIWSVYISDNSRLDRENSTYIMHTSLRLIYLAFAEQLMVMVVK